MEILGVIVFARKYGEHLSDGVIGEIVECLGTKVLDGRWYVQKGQRTLQITQLYFLYCLEADYYDFRYGWRLKPNLMIRRRLTAKQHWPLWYRISLL